MNNGLELYYRSSYARYQKVTAPSLEHQGGAVYPGTLTAFLGFQARRSVSHVPVITGTYSDTIP